MKTLVSRMAVTMSPSPADRLQGALDTAFDHGRRHALAVGAGLAEQLTHFGELDGFFPIGQLPRRNDFTYYGPAEGHFHPVCIHRKRANELLNCRRRGVNADAFHGHTS